MADKARNQTIFFICVQVLVWSFPPAVAHVPVLESGETSLASAVEISDPLKSWAYYGELSEIQKPQFYYFHGTADTEVSLIMTVSPANPSFSPDIALIGSGIEGVQTPWFIEVPPEYGALEFQGKTPLTAKYEGFGPSAFYEVSSNSLKIPKNGDYYLAVYDSEAVGKFGMAIGRAESFSFWEWLTTPIALFSVYLWGGSTPGLLMTPFAVSVSIGILLMVMRRNTALRRKSGSAYLLGHLSAILLTATSLLIFLQMGAALNHAKISPEVLVTVVRGLIPALLAFWTYRLTCGSHEDSDAKKLVVIGALSLATWGGFLVGGVMAFISGIMATRRRRQVW